MELSNHFKKHWRGRVGGRVPTVREVEAMIERSVIVQRGRVFRLHNGSRYKRLGIYWDIRRSVVMTIDEQNGVAVSVFGLKMKEVSPRIMNRPRLVVSR